MVDYNGLENRRTERYRGFESLSLRHEKSNPQGLLFFRFVETGRLTPGREFFQSLRFVKEDEVDFFCFLYAFFLHY